MKNKAFTKSHKGLAIGHNEIATGLKPLAMTGGVSYEIATLPAVARNDELGSVIARTSKARTRQSQPIGKNISLQQDCHGRTSSSLLMTRLGFTLAEVLITLAIIGVVAAMAIPSVISNAQQQEFKTGLRKAVSVLNSAITMNIALDGESPYDNGDLFRYLQRHMSIMKSTKFIPWGQRYLWFDGNGMSSAPYAANNYNANSAFYTTDGMRFEFRYDINYTNTIFGVRYCPLHESGIFPNLITTNISPENPTNNMGCGSYGLANNPSNTTKAPCIITVDVNGDRKPHPSNAYGVQAENNYISYSIFNPNAKKVSDIFSILITEDRAIPYGVLAQKAMYQAQK